MLNNFRPLSLPLFSARALLQHRQTMKRTITGCRSSQLIVTGRHQTGLLIMRHLRQTLHHPLITTTINDQPLHHRRTDVHPHPLITRLTLIVLHRHHQMAHTITAHRCHHRINTEAAPDRDLHQALTMAAHLLFIHRVTTLIAAIITAGTTIDSGAEVARAHGCIRANVTGKTAGTT